MRQQSSVPRPAADTVVLYLQWPCKDDHSQLAFIVSGNHDECLDQNILMILKDSSDFAN